jgi:hypothetical protein
MNVATDFIPTADDKKFDTNPSLEKVKIDLTSPAMVMDAVEKAFDYRGDVTLGLKDGGTIQGYIFNRESKVADPYLEMYPADKDEQIKVPYSKLASVYFSGVDTASGRSWTAWLTKYKAKEASTPLAP